MPQSSAPLPRTAVVGFALGSLGTGVYSTVPTILLLFYCTEILLMPPSVAATIVFVPKAWAILWDPLVGAWSDRCRSKHGRRAPFILAGTLGVATTFALLFNAPDSSSATTVGYVMAVYFVMASAYSIFAVPYVAIPAEISPVAAERERLMAWRMAFGLLGVMIGAGIAPHLVSLGGGGRRGYSFMAIAIATACGLAMLATYVTVRRIYSDDHGLSGPALELKTGLRLMATNPDYVRLWAAYLLSMSGATLLIAIVPYYVTHVLNRSEAQAGTAMLALLTGTVACIPAWRRAMRRWGGWKALSGAVLAYALVAACFASFSGSRHFIDVLLLFLVLGFPFAGLQLVSFTMLAHLAHDSARDGARHEGLYTGIWTAGEKLGLAIGPAAAGIGLAAIGYTSGSTGQTANSLAGIRIVMAFGPALFLVPAVLVLITRRRE